MAFLGTTEPGRGGRDQQAGRRERPARLRQHQPRVDGRRLEVHRHRPGRRTASLRHHHNVQTMQHRRSFMDRHKSELHSSNWRMGKVLRNSGVKVFQIETTLNNDTFGTVGPDVGAAEARVGVDRHATAPRSSAMKAGLDRMPTDGAPQDLQQLAGAVRHHLGAGRRGRGRARGHHRRTCSSSSSCRSRARPTSSRWGCPTSAPTT